MSSLVEVQIQAPVARIRLNHPPLNILSNAMRGELNAALDRIEAAIGATGDGVRVVVFEAAGERAFSVGSDLKEFPPDEAGGRGKIEFEQRQLERIERLAAITVASLRGLVLGGGAELMLATDIRIASSDAQIGFPEIKVGGFPAAGGIWRLTRDVGPARAKQMLLFGQTISAQTAVDFGLVQECVGGPQLAARVEGRVAELVALPGASLAAIKRCVAAAAAADDGIARFTTNEYGRLYRGSDIFEGLRAFIEKRPPRYNRGGGQAKDCNGKTQ